MKKLSVFSLIVSLLFVFSCEDKKLYGMWTQWYENGEREIIHYRNGIENGLNIYWYKNGQKKYEGSYKTGRKDGSWTFWYENGKIKRERIFNFGRFVDEKNY